MKYVAGSDGEILKNEDGTYHIEPITRLPQSVIKWNIYLPHAIGGTIFIGVILFLVHRCAFSEFSDLLSLAGLIALFKWIWSSWVLTIIFGFIGLVLFGVVFMLLRPFLLGINFNQYPHLFVDQIVKRAKIIRTDGLVPLDNYSFGVLSDDALRLCSPESVFNFNIKRTEITAAGKVVSGLIGGQNWDEMEKIIGNCNMRMMTNIRKK
jgi:hypothetical protein